MSRRLWSVVAAIAALSLAGFLPALAPGGARAAELSATALGVTASEVSVLVVLEGGVNYTSSGEVGSSVTPRDRYYDLGLPASHYTDQGDFGVTHVTVRALRAWQDNLNARYDFHGRQLRFTVYFTSEPQLTVVEAQQTAVQNVAAVGPFAMVPLLSASEPAAIEAYVEGVSGQGVVSFADLRELRESWLSSLPTELWNFSASVDTAAALFSSYVCDVVAPSPAARTGTLTGDVIGAVLGEEQVRRYGFIWNADYRNRSLVEASEIIRDAVADCGVTFEAEAVVTDCCMARSTSQLPAIDEMLQFRARGVTTVLWAGGFDSRFTDAAAALGYQPEWVLLGEGDLDNTNAMRIGVATPAFHERSVTVTSRLFQEVGDDRACATDLHATAPEWEGAALDIACAQHRAITMLALGVQHAGPDLTVDNVEAGLRAIAPSAASGRQDPAFYLDGDHTMVKDAQALRWDGAGDHPVAEAPGCFRAVNDGSRHRVGEWPAGNIDSWWSPADPCDAHSAPIRFGLL